MPPTPRNDERAEPDGHVALLPAAPASATTARHLVRRLFPASATADQRATAELLTTELVANAVVHARTPCRLRLSCPRDGVLRVEVSDRAAGMPTVQDIGPSELDGRGLQLVDALATQWGITRSTPAEKTVWFETPCRRAAGP